jgi:lipoprotein-anchoring transpeptidase ErfK/SrfK
MSKNSKPSKKNKNNDSGHNTVNLRSSRLNYQSYTSGSRTPRSIEPSKRRSRQRRSVSLLFLLIIIVALAGVCYVHFKPFKAKTTARVVTEKTAQSTKTVANTTSPRTTPPPAASAVAPQNVCANNTLPQLALVSISQRTMWACQGTNQIYSTPVVTGMENYPADLTPTGTYYISSKQTNLYLDGSDSTGSWHDYVYYWMPFLHNKYGTYGFHDATWRPANAFGNISPYTNQASHGCVEMPLTAAAWLFNWIEVGSTVTIEA